MHGIYKVEEMLCDELEKIGEKDELTAGSLETADKLSHALKNVQKIIDYYEEMGEGEGGYSRREGDGMWTAEGSYARDGRGGSYRGGSYARGRGRYAKRDSMGRYSSRGYSRAEGHEKMVMELRELMADAPNEDIKRRMKDLVSEIEMM